MEIQKNIANALRKAMKEQGKTVSEFSEELGVPITSVKQYIRGNSNPRADTIALLANKLNTTPAELISELPESAIQAKLVLRAAQEVGQLAPEQKEECIQLFLALVDIFEQKRNGAPKPLGSDTPLQTK